MDNEKISRVNYIEILFTIDILAKLILMIGKMHDRKFQRLGINFFSLARL